MSPIDRRQLLKGGAVGLGAAALGRGALAGAQQPPHSDVPPALLARVPFDGPHQAGVLTPAQAQATFLALDSVAANRGDLASALQALSYKARSLMAGGPTPVGGPEDPPADTGVVGPVVAPDSLTVTIGFGASLFDDRYGLSAPAGLATMPRFATDQIDPAIAHGDLMVQVCAGQRDTVVHAVRELLRTTRGSFVPRWTLDGFSGAARGPSKKSSARNLFAFRDGTANPDVRDDALMKQLVWTPDGGTFQVVRVIRMHVEFWDRVGLREQENIIGRHRDSGAPLGGTDEFQDPKFESDPDGKRIPLDAHIRLANPRTGGTADQRILRRGFNYHRGLDEAAALDQGLVFVAFNQDPERQFATIQRRLAEEPMVDYITPVGGGYFYVPPGTGGDKFGWIGKQLVGS